MLAACEGALPPASVELPVPTPACNQTAPLIGTASPLPTGPIVPVITPDPAQLAQWRGYELALAKGLLAFLPPGEVLCEWELLGSARREVYVWAKCEGTVLVGEIDPGYPSASKPAVIHLGPDGAVQSVDAPGAGSLYASDIRRMFPADAQQRIFDDLIDYRRLSEHLDWRRVHPGEPPWFVLAATVTP